MNKILLTLCLALTSVLSCAEDSETPKEPDVLVENYKIVPASSATRILVPVYTQAKSRSGKVGQYYKITTIVVSRQIATRVIYCYDNSKDDSLVCDYTLEQVRIRGKLHKVGKFFLLKEEYKKSYRSS